MAGGRSGKRSLPPTAFCLLLTAHCLLLLKSRRSGKRDLRYACFTAYRSLPTVLPHPQFPVPVRYSLFPIPCSLFPVPYSLPQSSPPIPQRRSPPFRGPRTMSRRGRCTLPQLPLLPRQQGRRSRPPDYWRAW